MQRRNKIWVSGIDRDQINQMVRSYQRHFMADKNSDPNNLFRKSINFESNNRNCSRTKQHKRAYYDWYDDSPKKNLQLYLPQIDHDRFRAGSKDNSDNYSNSRIGIV